MKREPRELDALVAETLRLAGPSTACALAASLRKHGQPMTDAQAYRVLKRLAERGEARHVWQGRRYAAREPDTPPSLVLACDRCGVLDFVPSADAHAALRAAAAARGFLVDEVILEAGGLCHGCRAGTETGAQETVR